jgi:hypothetical protein
VNISSQSSHPVRECRNIDMAHIDMKLKVEQPDDFMFDELFEGDNDWLFDPNSPNFQMGGTSPRESIINEYQSATAIPKLEGGTFPMTDVAPNPIMSSLGDDDKGTAKAALNSSATKKRKIANNPNAQLIASATAETLESMNIDPNSKEGKKTKRQIRNRMSAQHHRDKKNQYIQTLEDLMKQKDFEINQLRQEVQMIRSENVFLRDNVSSSCLSLADAKFKFKSAVNNVLDGSTSNTDNEYGSTEYSETVSEEHDSLPSSSSSNQSVASAPPSPMHDFQPVFSGSFGTMGRALTIVSMSCMMVFMILGNNSSLTMDSGNTLSLGMAALPEAVRENVHRRLTAIDDDASMEELLKVMSSMSSTSVLGKAASPVVKALSVLYDHHRPSSLEQNHRDVDAIVHSQVREKQYQQQQQYVPMSAIDSRSSSLTNTTSSTQRQYVSSDRRYLRRGDNHNASIIKQEEHIEKNALDLGRPFRMMLGGSHSHSTDVTRTHYELPDSLNHQWPPSPAFFDYSVLSYSTVVMTQGKALLDPSLSLSFSKDRGGGSGSAMDIVNLSSTLRPTATTDSHRHPMHSAGETAGVKRSTAIPLPPPSHLVEMPSMNTLTDSSNSSLRVLTKIGSTSVPTHTMGASGSPAENGSSSSSSSTAASDSTSGIPRSSPHSSARFHTTTATTTPHSTQGSGAPSTVKMIQQPYANILTIQLPASSIRLGNDWATSKGSTKESIMSVLNINATASSSTRTGDSGSQGGSSSNDDMSDRSFVENSFVELNCVILGAKLVHTAGSA